MLWELFLVVVGLSWVFPRTVCQILLAWQNANVGKKRKRIWMATPLCLFWSWANLYSVDNIDSLVDFFGMVGV